MTDPRQVSLSMGMDALRICLGRPTKSHTKEEVISWMIQRMLHELQERVNR